MRRAGERKAGGRLTAHNRRARINTSYTCSNGTERGGAGEGTGLPDCVLHCCCATAARPVGRVTAAAPPAIFVCSHCRCFCILSSGCPCRWGDWCCVLGMVRLVHRCWSLLLVRSRCDPRRCLVIPPLPPPFARRPSRRRCRSSASAAAAGRIICELRCISLHSIAAVHSRSVPCCAAPLRSGSLSPLLRAALAPASIRESI